MPNEQSYTRSPLFFELVDFLLQFAPVLPEDADARAQLAALGVDGSATFRLATLDPTMVTQLQAGIDEGIADLAKAAARSSTSVGLFGTREQMRGKYVSRDLGAMKGIYGLPLSEAWYGGWLVDADGNQPIGERGYTVTFAADELPKVKYFWSITMYRLPERLLVANPIDRYSIGDRTPRLHYNKDGSLTLTLSSEQPPDPANWLPAPEGPFLAAVRCYGGDTRMKEGTYVLPPLVPMNP